MTWRAWIRHDIERQRVEMGLVQDYGPEQIQVFGPKGSVVVNRGESWPEGFLFSWPEETWPAIEEALDRFRGRASHQATESAVLREWLEVERGRVDRLLARTVLETIE